jgi:hypothetical protein
LVAVPVRSVTRLVLPHEVEIVSEKHEAASLGVVKIGGEAHAAWDLGELLGLDPIAAAWILFRVAHEGTTLSIALRTGACLMVQPLRPEVSIPGAVFSARGKAFPSAFATSSVRGKTPALYGLWLDPARLLTGDELSRSHAILAAETKGTRRS